MVLGKRIGGEGVREKGGGGGEIFSVVILLLLALLGARAVLGNDNAVIALVGLEGDLLL